MRRSISVREARENLSALIDAAEKGESVLITRHGKEVARLGPADTGARGPLPDLTEFRASMQVKGKPMSEVLADLRKQARY